MVMATDETATVDGLLKHLRRKGWTVAVHNDYRLDGVMKTFWLWEKDGRCVKGEALTDYAALVVCESKICEMEAAPMPSFDAEAGVKERTLKWGVFEMFGLMEAVAVVMEGVDWERVNRLMAEGAPMDRVSVNELLPLRTAWNDLLKDGDTAFGDLALAMRRKMGRDKG